MRFLCKCLATTLLCLPLALVGLTPIASGQSQNTMAIPTKTDRTETADQGWHIDVAPYLWLPGVFGTVGAANHDSSVHVTVADVLSNFNFGLAGAVEVRYGRILIPITDNVPSVKVKPCLRQRSAIAL